MGLENLIVAPLYIILIYISAYLFRGAACSGNPILKRYFIPGLTVKIIGGVALGLIYQFYYTGGDTTNFFLKSSHYIWEAFLESPFLGLKLIFTDFSYDSETDVFSRNIHFWNDPSSYFVVRVSGLFGFITFHSYYANAVLFAYFSFWGMWLLFLCLFEMYPTLHKELAISVFFIPSAFFWGSGLMKDTLTIGCLGYFFYGFYHGLIKRNKLTLNILLMVIALLMIKEIKIYIIMCFAPAALVWLFLDINDKIKSPITKQLIRPIMLIIGLASAYLAADQLTKDDKKYKLDEISKTAKVTAEWIAYSTRENGSKYTLGEQDGTILGMIKLIPAAIFVTLFQPFLWQVKNPVMLLAAFEALWFFWFTIKNIVNSGGLKVLGIIKDNRYVAFAIIFSLIFAFGVGISSYNFGTLVRYKIPLLPFYASAMYIIKYEADKKRIEYKIKSKNKNFI